MDSPAPPSQIETCAAEMVEREMEEMKECLEFQVLKSFHPYWQLISFFFQEKFGQCFENNCYSEDDQVGLIKC